jgi:hypothetical protein
MKFITFFSSEKKKKVEKLQFMKQWMWEFLFSIMNVISNNFQQRNLLQQFFPSSKPIIPGLEERNEICILTIRFMICVVSKIFNSDST